MIRSITPWKKHVYRMKPIEIEMNHLQKKPVSSSPRLKMKARKALADPMMAATSVTKRLVALSGMRLDELSSLLLMLWGNH